MDLLDLAQVLVAREGSVSRGKWAGSRDSGPESIQDRGPRAGGPGGSAAHVFSKGRLAFFAVLSRDMMVYRRRAKGARRVSNSAVDLELI